jgi:hypothetical protein
LVRCAALRCGKPPFVLGRNALWIPQYTLDLLPDSFVQPVRADLLVRAHTLTAEPISVATAAPVICILPSFALSRAQADWFAVVGITA